MVYCSHCGNQLPEPMTPFCPYCGTPTRIQNVVNAQAQNPQPIQAPQRHIYSTPTSDKSKGTATKLCLLGFIGIGGLHHFYVGRMGMGILYLATMGFLFIGTLIDLISLLQGTFRDNVGMPLRA